MIVVKLRRLKYDYTTILGNIVDTSFSSQIDKANGLFLLNSDQSPLYITSLFNNHALANLCMVLKL